MTGKGRGALVALLALVAVLVVTFAGHGLLSNKLLQQDEQDSAATSLPTEDSSTADDVPMLADYDATVYTDLGEPIELSSIADSRPLVINFWATWCPYCVDEMPDYQKIVADYCDRVSFAFVDVTDGQREKADDAQEWLAKQGFDDLPDYYDLDLAAQLAFGAYSLPTTVVVAASGEIVSVMPGRIDAAYLRGALNTLV